MSKYCYFHKDLGHETNQCWELRHQIEEAVKSGQLAHLVKSIKKGKTKASDTLLGEWKKGDKDIVLVEAPILMVNRGGGHTSKIKSTEESVNGIGEITFLPISSFDNSPDPIIIRLKPTIMSLRVDSKIPLVGFSGEHLWPLGEVPLEVTIEETPYTRTETLNFVIVRSNSLYNLLIRRTTMQKMGIVVSIIHAAIKFRTPCGIGTVFSTYEPNKVKEGQEKTYANMTGILITIMVGGKPFNTEHKLNEYTHSGLAPERNETTCKEVDDLTKEGI
ncbi:hypothetical protein Tco_0854855 [Tanacetum coccineum]